MGSDFKAFRGREDISFNELCSKSSLDINYLEAFESGKKPLTDDILESYARSYAAVEQKINNMKLEHVKQLIVELIFLSRS
jgi:transcriptional regulator with XRE-family HTH domain